jgi:stage II sporulation protein D
MRMGLVLLLAALALYISACAQAYAAVPCEIRVVLSDDTQSVQVGGALEWIDGSTDVCTSGDVTEVKRVGEQVKVVVGDKGIQAQRLVATPATGYVRFGGRDYRGRLEFFVGKDGGVIVLNVLPLEDYLLGVVPSEMPSGWPQPALQAQAVAARTYAVSRMLNRRAETFDVYATVSDQVYLGVSHEKASSSQAVKATAGQIVTFNGKPITAYYCSDAGGCTKCGPSDHPYLQPVPIEAPDSPNRQWSIPINRERLGKLAEKKGATVGTVKSISTQQDPDSGHLLKLIVTGDKGKAEIAGNTLRSLLGLNVMKSTRAWVEIVGQPAPKVVPASKVAAKLPPPKQKKTATKDAGEVVEIATGKLSKAQDAADDGLALLEPFARPYIALVDGVADRKLRTAYMTDGERVVACAQDIFAASVPVATAALVPIADTALKVATKKNSPVVKADADLPATSGAVGTEGIILHGSGYGHGMGMSQYGAKTLAERGYSYDQILTYFYSGVSIDGVPRSLGGSGVVKTSKQPAKESVRAKPAEEEVENEAVEIGKFAPGR